MKAEVLEIGNFHEDDRAQRLLDVFPFWPGQQLNVSYVNSTEHVVAWHAHKLQTDYWICLKGSLKVGLAEPGKGSQELDRESFSPSGYAVRFEYLSDKNFRVLAIPPRVYHGYTALEPGTILMYFLTKKYNPADEYRCHVGAFDEEWSTPNK